MMTYYNTDYYNTHTHTHTHMEKKLQHDQNIAIQYSSAKCNQFKED